jgi:cytoskeletal protein RodZ
MGQGPPAVALQGELTMAKRRYAAPGGRVLVTGLTVSATFGIVAGLAANQPSWAASTSDTTVSTVSNPSESAPDATVSPSTSTPTTTTPTAATPASTVAPATTGPPRTTIVIRTVERIIQVDAEGQPIAPPETVTPAPAAPRAVPAAAPSAGAPSAGAPAATNPPPVVTAAPAPPPTAAPPPPTTAKPACTGSKCP